MGSTMSNDYATFADLGSLEVGDVTLDTFDAYVGAVQEADGTAAHTHAVLYRAFHALFENSTDRQFGKRVGLGPSRVSDVKLFALARDKGVSATARGKMARQAWSRLISGANKNADVRTAIREKDTKTADVVSAIAEAWKLTHSPTSADTGSAGQGEGDKDERAARPNDSVESFGAVLADLKAIAKRLEDAAPPSKTGQIASAQNVLAKMAEIVAKHATAADVVKAGTAQAA